MAYDIGPTVGILGEAEFKKAMTGINDEFKLLGSEMKLSVSQFEKNDKSMANLAAQSKVLVKEIDVQKGKIALINDQYDKQSAKLAELKTKLDATKAAFAADSDEVTRARNEYNNQSGVVTKLSTDLNNANTTLNKFTSELAKNKDTALQTATAQKELGEKIEAAGKKMSGIGDSMTKYVTVPALAAATALAALVIKTTDTADKLQQMSDKTGLSTERLQELAYVGAKTDTELETMTGSQSKLIRAMSAANDGTKKQKDAFAELGISVTDNDGKLRDSNVVWGEAIDALGKMSNETERDAVSLVLFGKSALDLNPLIKAGSAEIANLSKEAHTNGAVMSGESVEAMDKFSDSIAAAKLSIGTAAGEITVKMLPTLNKLLPIVQKDVVPAIGKFAEGVGDLIVGFNDLGPITQGVVTTLAALVVVAGPVLSVVGTGITMYGTMTTAAGVHAIAMATATGAAEGLTAAEGVATVGAQGLTAAMGPIAVALGLVAAAYVTAGIIAENTMTDAEKQAKDLEEKSIALAKACDDTSTAFDNQSGSTDTAAAAAKGLSDELYTLRDKENKSNVEKSRMATIIKQLNDLMPDLNLSIDEQTGALNKNQKATEDLVEAKYNQQKLQESQDRQLELYSEGIDLTNEMAEAQDALAKSTSTANKSAEDYSFWDLFNPSKGTDLANAGTDVGNLTNTVDTLSVSLAKNAADMQAEKDASAKWAGSLTDMSKEVTEATGQTAADLEAQAAAVKKSAEDQQKIVEQYYTDLEQSEKDHQAEMGSLETLGIERSKLTAAELKKNRDQQVKDYQDWRAGLKLIAQKVPEDVLAELEELGPTYDQVIDDLANMTPEQIAAWVESWRAPAEEAEKAAEEEIGKLPAYAAGAIISTTAEFQKTALMEAAAKEAGRKATAAYVAGLKETPAGSKSDYYSRLTAAFANGNLPSYAVGTRYLPSDMLIQAHQGEMIVPKSENPYANSGNGQTLPVGTGVSVNITMNGLTIREEADIGKLSTSLASKVAGARKAVGA